MDTEKEARRLKLLEDFLRGRSERFSLREVCRECYKMEDEEITNYVLIRIGKMIGRIGEWTKRQSTSGERFYYRVAPKNSTCLW